MFVILSSLLANISQNYVVYSEVYWTILMLKLQINSAVFFQLRGQPAPPLLSIATHAKRCNLASHPVKFVPREMLVTFPSLAFGDNVERIVIYWQFLVNLVDFLEEG